MARFQKGQSGNPGARFRKGISGNPGGKPKGLPENIVKMAQMASGDAMRWLIDVAHGTVKGIGPELRMKAVAMLHERAYGRPAQNISVDIALKRAVEGHDPAEQLRILRDMRSRYVAQLEAPIEITPEVLEDE